MDELTTLGFDDSDGFDIALRRRGRSEDPEAIVELIVNGMFAMDTTDASSEVALADIVPNDASCVLVGGLGLGFTAGALLDRLPHCRVTVVELSGALITWARANLVDNLTRVADDPRATLVHADVKDVLRDATHSWDAILLDVDNGPSFLVHDHNAPLYEPDLLSSAIARLSPGGLLAVWCERVSAQLDARLRELSSDVGAVTVGVDRDGHHIDYAIHTARA